jgi:hypothetical protein
VLKLADIRDIRVENTLLLAVAAALWCLAVAALYQIHFYLRIPADLLSFSESVFITDIVRLQQGGALYALPSDNSNHPYSPGAQLLTYAIARLWGRTDSVAVYRHIQFAFVIGAAAVAAGTVSRLVKRFVPSPGGSAHRLWFAVAAPLLFLIALDPTFNPYTHSLHNDGLALLVSACAFWLVVRHAAGPKWWVITLMAFLPAIGFMVKQNQLLWLPLFALYLFLSEPARWPRALAFLAAGAILFAGAIGLSYAFWGYDYLWWVFSALGSKDGSLLRSGLHFLQAGAYLIMGFVAVWVLDWGPRDRTAPILWILWFALLVAGAYTSGVAWMNNHMGPAVLISGVLFMAAMARVWSGGRGDRSHPTGATVPFVAAILLFLPGALGLIRLPRNPVPPDIVRYIRDIEAEFEGHAADEVLLDNGSWIYLREGVVMKDRSSPAALHVLGSYREVGRIPEVKDVQHWWPKNLLLEIVVLELKEQPARPVSEACRSEA